MARFFVRYALFISIGPGVRSIARWKRGKDAVQGGESFMNRLLAICFKKIISFISFMKLVSFCMESGCGWDGLAQYFPFIDQRSCSVEQMKIIDINHTKTPDFFENHHQKLPVRYRSGFGFQGLAWRIVPLAGFISLSKLVLTLKSYAATIIQLRIQRNEKPHSPVSQGTG